MTVYIIRAGEGGPVKIGWTAGDVAERVAAIQAGNHETLNILRVMEGDRFTESALHREFAHLRIAREWFLFDPQMLSAQPPEAAQGIATTASALVIDKFGGASALARLLGKPATTVQSWAARGSIPSRRQPTLLAIAKARGIALTADELIAAHREEGAAA